MGQFVHFDLYLFEISCLFREFKVSNQTQNQRCPSIEHNIANFISLLLVSFMLFITVITELLKINGMLIIDRRNSKCSEL
jgi:hypothetical protein